MTRSPIEQAAPRPAAPSSPTLANEPSAILRPDRGMTAQDLDPFAARPMSESGHRTLMIAGGVVGAGLLLCGLGLVFGGGRRPAPSTAPASAAITQQQRLGRTAHAASPPAAASAAAAPASPATTPEPPSTAAATSNP